MLEGDNLYHTKHFMFITQHIECKYNVCLTCLEVYVSNHNTIKLVLPDSVYPSHFAHKLQILLNNLSCVSPRSRYH